MVERHAKGVDCKQKHVIEVLDRKQVTCPRCKMLLQNPEIAKKLEEEASALNLEFKQRVRRIHHERLNTYEQSPQKGILCPKCGRHMKTRKNSKDGSYFYGCSGYPVCKVTRRIQKSK